MVSIILKRGKEKAVLQRHPWVFSGALQELIGKPENGDLVKVLAIDRSFLAYGYYNDASRVAVRLLTWEEDNIPDEQWWRMRLQDLIFTARNCCSASWSAP